MFTINICVTIGKPHSNFESKKRKQESDAIKAYEEEFDKICVALDAERKLKSVTVKDA